MGPSTADGGWLQRARTIVGRALASGLLCALISPGIWAADEPGKSPDQPPQGAQSGTQVMEAFKEAREERTAFNLTEERQHQILFIMGITLLILLMTTGALGIAMGVYGKQVYVAHMVTAGLSITLAVAHSVVAIVWFFPF